MEEKKIEEKEEEKKVETPVETKVEESEETNPVKAFYKKHKSKFNFAYMVIICLIVAKLLTSFVFISVMVDGSSMSPTLTNGDKAITDGLFYKITGIDRFDIVIFEKKGYDERLVKRVIGLPGETVRFEKGVLYINGEKVDQDFIPEELAAQTDTPYYNDTFECTLKDDEYYVVGDNRVHGKSADSRYFGPIKKSQIKGVGLLKFATCKSVSESGACKGLKLIWPTTVK